MAIQIFVAVVIAPFFFFLSSSDAYALHPEMLALKMSMKQTEWSSSRIYQCSRSGASLDRCRAVMHSYKAGVRGTETTMESFEACVKGSSDAQICYEMATDWGLLEWVFLPLAIPFYLLASLLYLGFVVPLMIVVTLIKIPLFLAGITESWYLFVSLW